MSVLIDDRELAVDELGLQTVGQVLAHVQRNNRLVINMLIDGQEPDLEHIQVVRQSPVQGRTVYIETAEPRQMALDVLDAIGAEFEEAERLKNEAADLIQRGETSKAMEKLGGCFTSWQHAQESVGKTAQLLRLDLDLLKIDGLSLAEMANAFSEQLRQIKNALEAHDFVLLGDILMYEMSESTQRWQAALAGMRKTIA